MLATVVSEELAFDNLSMVGVDDRKGGAAAIDHLLANGHKDILILGADPAYSNPSYKRLQGCNDSFTAHGMELAPRRYLKTSFSFEAAYQAMDAWLKEGQRPQAVFAMSDTCLLYTSISVKNVSGNVFENQRTGYGADRITAFPGNVLDGHARHPFLRFSKTLPETFSTLILYA